MVKWRKWSMGLTAAALTMTALTACSSSSSNGESGATKAPSASPDASPSATAEADPYDKLPMSISVVAFDRGEIPTSEGTYENNRWTKLINEQSGIDVKFVPIPRNSLTEKLNVMFAAGEAPEIVFDYDRNYIMGLAQQGVIQPMEEYIEKYSTHYKKYLEDNPDLKAYLYEDGHLYAVATKRDDMSIANHMTWIRKDWLDKLGLKMPTTDQELLEVAKAFKEQDPDGNGKPDTYGFTVNNQWFDLQVSNMFLADSGYWYMEGDKLQPGFTLDRYKDSLAFSKKMFEEGLIDKEILVDTSYNRAKQHWITGKAGIYFAGANINNDNESLIQNVEGSEPVPLPIVSTVHGKSGYETAASPNFYVAFNKEMKNPKAAVAYLDWMVSEGWKPLRLGVEGVHYQMEDGKFATIDADKNAIERKGIGEYAILHQYNYTSNDFKANPDPIKERVSKLRVEATKIAFQDKFRRDLPYNPTIPEFLKINTDFGPKLEEIRTQVYIGGDNYTADKAIEEIRKEWKRLGGDNVEKLVNDWYNDNKANW